jgi:hypothetical protein
MQEALGANRAGAGLQEPKGAKWPVIVPVWAAAVSAVSCVLSRLVGSSQGWSGPPECAALRCNRTEQQGGSCATCSARVWTMPQSVAV